MLAPRIKIPKKKIAAFCQRHYIIKLSLFGSVLHETFRPDSDIDVLVEFEPGHVPGFAFVRLEDELSEIFEGRKVDLVTPKFLNHRIRPQIEAEAVVQYAQE